MSKTRITWKLATLLAIIAAVAVWSVSASVMHARNAGARTTVTYSQRSTALVDTEGQAGQSGNDGRGRYLPGIRALVPVQNRSVLFRLFP